MHYMTTTKPGLVLLAGELRNFSILPERWAFIAAADGGARHALQQNVRPDYVIGDFDSLSDEELARLSAAGVPCARLPRDKDLTDGEAALQWAIARGDTREIVIAGGLGGRFDHALGSIILLEQLLQAGLHGYVTDGPQSVYLLRDGLVVPGVPGDRLSIIPLTEQVEGVSVHGVRWPLHNAALPAASTLTVSNEFVDSEATLSVRSGRALVVRVQAQFA